jgi:hypothetical protein
LRDSDEGNKEGTSGCFTNSVNARCNSLVGIGGIIRRHYKPVFHFDETPENVKIEVKRRFIL